ncbi:hypothetical protein TruAng_007070 [Truncatella angustata]|nr:hypothetical protein TruAng_007070 [Truncatella angustata]
MQATDGELNDKGGKTESTANKVKAFMPAWLKNLSIPSRVAYQQVGESDLTQPGALSEKSKLPKALRIGLVIFKVFFVIFYCYETWWFCLHWGIDYTIFGNENIFHDPPVGWTNLRLERAGFHDSRHAVFTAYEGAPNAQNNAAWNDILSVGVVAINEKENSKLTNGSAPLLGKPGQYVVELEMFHQLHCLKWIRDQFWELNAVVTENGTIEDFPQRVDHTDHCIDYLRQIIMCHGDITPLTMEWNTEINGFLAHHTTEHHCRSFDMIWNWAEGRNTTRMVADGRHKNVELSVPEKSD